VQSSIENTYINKKAKVKKVISVGVNWEILSKPIITLFYKVAFRNKQYNKELLMQFKSINRNDLFGYYAIFLL
jgi:hypothetical protein